MAHARAPSGLTLYEDRFVKNLGKGMTQTQAARAAGYKFPSDEGYKLMQREHIRAAVAAERAKYEKKADMSRQKVMDGLKESIEMARLVSDPNAMVAGWREIAKICGYYAPEVKRLELSGPGGDAQHKLQHMTDEELVRLIIEGESTRLPDDDQAGSEVPMLSAGPSDDDSTGEHTE